MNAANILMIVELIRAGIDGIERVWRLAETIKRGDHMTAADLADARRRNDDDLARLRAAIERNQLERNPNGQ